MARMNDIVDFCADFLDIARFRDAAVNGLQVEGGPEVHRLATTVSVSREVISDALAWKADALLVHHGLLWGQRLGPIIGPLRTRLRLLLANDLNLLAYHLPLDAHPEVGNNAQLARALGLSVAEPFAEIDGQFIGAIATSTEPVPLLDLIGQVIEITDREPIVLEGGPRDVQRVAILSGSGSFAVDQAASADCQVLLTGDARESTMAMAREIGVTIIAAGHEATERMGVQALGNLLSQRYCLEERFLNDPNPI
jgi:dinuclear metal center YbgI/SA1388 family protein